MRDWSYNSGKLLKTFYRVVTAARFWDTRSVVMRRKAQAKSDPVVPPEILEKAKLSLSNDQLKKAVKCTVCGAETSSDSLEQLCWVCRRLKISAWRDNEQQPAQE